MLKVRISGIVLELPKELVVQIPYFNDLYNEKDCIIDINEPAISLNALLCIIELFHGLNLPMQIEYVPTFEFLGIDYTLFEELTLSEFLNNKTKVKAEAEKYEPFKLNKYLTEPTITNQEILRSSLIECNVEGRFAVNIDRYADLIDKVYIKIELPKLNHGTYWKNKVGLQIIKRIEVIAGGQIILIGKSSLIELEHYINSDNDYWKIFDYPEETRKNLSCNSETVNTIIIPFKLCENTNYSICLLAMCFHNLRIRIYLNDIEQLIEGSNEGIDEFNINKLQLLGKYTFINKFEDRAELARNRLQIDFILYDYHDIIIQNSNKFRFGIEKLKYNKHPILIIIKINGEIISENFKKVGEYYILKWEQCKEEFKIQLKDIGDYNINIIAKYIGYKRYASGLTGVQRLIEMW